METKAIEGFSNKNFQARLSALKESPQSPLELAPLSHVS